MDIQTTHQSAALLNSTVDTLIAAFMPQAVQAVSGMADVAVKHWSTRRCMRRGLLLTPWQKANSHHESLRFFDRWRKGKVKPRQFAKIQSKVLGLRDRAIEWYQQPILPHELRQECISRFAWTGGVYTVCALEAGDTSYRDLERECLRYTVWRSEMADPFEDGVTTDVDFTPRTRWVVDTVLSALVGTAITVHRAKQAAILGEHHTEIAR